jgi:uncharacterized protein (DUF2384 family)
MKRHPRLNTAQLRHVDLLERVIDAVTHDWPPGLAYMAVSEYCARRSEIDLLELVRVRRRVQRQLGTHIYCLARTIFTTDQAVLEWSSIPAIELGGRRPRELLATTTGARRVERLLRAMEHGVPS